MNVGIFLAHSDNPQAYICKTELKKLKYFTEERSRLKLFLKNGVRTKIARSSEKKRV